MNSLVGNQLIKIIWIESPTQMYEDSLKHGLIQTGQSFKTRKDRIVVSFKYYKASQYGVFVISLGTELVLIYDISVSCLCNQMFINEELWSKKLNLVQRQTDITDGHAVI